MEIQACRSSNYYSLSDQYGSTVPTPLGLQDVAYPDESHLKKYDSGDETNSAIYLTVPSEFSLKFASCLLWFLLLRFVKRSGFFYQDITKRHI